MFSIVNWKLLLLVGRVLLSAAQMSCLETQVCALFCNARLARKAFRNMGRGVLQRSLVVPRHVRALVEAIGSEGLDDVLLREVKGIFVFGFSVALGACSTTLATEGSTPARFKPMAALAMARFLAMVISGFGPRFCASGFTFPGYHTDWGRFSRVRFTPRQTSQQA